MSTATETCACGASITVDVRDGLVLGFRLAEWRKEHQHDDEVARLRQFEGQAFDVMIERNEARAAIARVRARHVKALGTDACEECSSWSLYRKVVPWPCATIRALDGDGHTYDRICPQCGRDHRLED